MVFDDLATQLAADRTTGTRDHHGLARDVSGNEVLPRHHNLSRQKIFNLNVRQIGNMRFAGNNITHRRDSAKLERMGFNH